MTAQSVILPLPSNHARFIGCTITKIGVETTKNEVFLEL